MFPIILICFIIFVVFLNSRKRQITKQELADYHKIELDIVWEQLTRSEASRLMDKLISQYGRCPKD